MERSTSLSVVVALLTEIRMSRRPCHVVPPSQHVPSRCTASMIASVRVVVAEAGEHLVEHDIVGDHGTTVGEAIGEPAGQPAAALDDVADA